MATREQVASLLQHLRQTIEVPEAASAKSLYIPRPALVGQDIPGFDLSQLLSPTILPESEYEWMEALVLEKFAAFIELYFEYRDATDPPTTWLIHEWGIPVTHSRGFFSNLSTKKYTDAQAVESQVLVLWAVSNKWNLELDTGPHHFLLTLPSGDRLGMSSNEFIHPDAQFTTAKVPEVDYQTLVQQARKGKTIRQPELARLYIGARCMAGVRGDAFRRAVETLAWISIYHRDLFEDDARVSRKNLWKQMNELINDETRNMVSGMRGIVVPDFISGRDFAKLFGSRKPYAEFWNVGLKKEFADSVILAIGGEITFQNNNKKGITNVNRIHREGRSR